MTFIQRDGRTKFSAVPCFTDHAQGRAGGFGWLKVIPIEIHQLPFLAC